MLSTWRDPLRVFDDFSTGLFDPFDTSFGTDRLGRRRATSRLESTRLVHLDAFETDNEFKVIAEVPGVPTDKIDVSVDNGLLTIKVAKPSPEYPVNFGMLRDEILYGSDSRVIRIPRGYHPEPSHCQAKDGVLCITFPKSEQSEAKKLQIQSS